MGTGHAITVEVVTGPHLAALETVWRRVLAQDPHATIFQTWEWNAAWWQWLGAGARLCVMVAYRKDEPVAIAPLLLRRGAGGAFWQVQFLGTGVSDYLGFIGLPETMPECIQAFLETLRSSSQWHLVDLQHLNPTHAVRVGWGESSTAAHTDRNGDSLHWWHQDVCPVMPLPSTWEEVFRQLSKKMRSNLGYYERLMRRHFEVSIETVTEEEGVPAALEEFFRLHRRRWRQRGLPGALYSNRLRQFHRTLAPQLARSGHLVLHLLRLNGQVAAVLYCFRYGPRTFYYLGGFEPALARYSPGTVLTAHAIRWAVASGCTEFDFLRGREAYKYRWPVEERANYRLIMWRPASWRSRFGLWWYAWQWQLERAVRARLLGT